MSHQEYLAALRQRVRDAAEGVLAGELDVLDGARQLTALLGELGFGWDDEDYRAVAIVESETDDLPIGQGRKGWAANALAAREAEIQSAIRWAEPFVLPACERLAARFRS